MNTGFITANGQELYYTRQGTGEPLLLIQGLSGDHNGWNGQTEKFKNHYTTISFDNRDVGQSSMADKAYTIADMADDTAGLLDGLGIENAHILGASMGGMIAQELALRHPKKVDKLILSCTMMQMDNFAVSFVEPWEFLVHNSTDGKALVAYIINMVMTHKFQQNAEAVATMTKVMLSNPHPQSSEAFSRQAHALKIHNATERLGKIRTPVLVLVGDQDILTPPWSAKQVAEKIPNSTLQILPGAGHCMFWEIVASFNDAVLSFLQD